MLPACGGDRSPRSAFEATIMIIATRILKLHRTNADIEIPIRLFAPERRSIDWSCRFEIEWPDEMLTRAATGIDAVQALLFALQMIGAQLYASDHHASGNLMWEA